MRRSWFQCYLLLVVLLAGSLASAADWTGAGSEPYWDIAENWSDNAVPSSSSTQNVNNVVTEDGTIQNPVIYTLEGLTDVCGNLNIGTTIGGEVGDGTLDMIDGTLKVSGNVFLGDDAGAYGLLNMDGGLIEVEGQFNVGQAGDGHLRMAGGHIIAHGTWMHIPNTGNSTGRVDLFGGVLETTMTFITRSATRSFVDISGGKIVVPNDTAGNLAGYISDGRITAYGGRGTVVTTVVADSNTTELAATADPAIMAKAWHESPENGETLFTVSPTLTWVAGQDANSHKVYLGTSEDALELLTEDPNMGVLSVDFYTMVADLTPGTTYYWRVDEVADDDTVTTGDIWSFMTVPPETSRPLTPEDGSTIDETSGVELTWEPGLNAQSFNVYFAEADKELDLVSESQTESNYVIPDSLVLGQTYRWKIDTFDGSNIYPGLEVSFKAGIAPATCQWNDADPANSLWSTPGNWAQNAIPGVGTNAQLRNDFPTAVIDANTSAYCSVLSMAWADPSFNCQLNVEGGTLTIENQIQMSRKNGMSTLVIKDGVVNCDFIRAWQGDQWIEMTGGELNVNNYIEIPRSYAAAEGCLGVFNLQDGIVRANTITLRSHENVYCKFNIAAGKLILDGDERSKMNGYIANGLLVAHYDLENDTPLETASISMAYDAETDKTTVVACKQQWQADFNGDCVVDELDRELLMSDWGFVTPDEVVWDINMTSDPVPDVVQVRNGKEGNYVMNGEGQMVISGECYLDPLVRDSDVAFDITNRFVAKSLSAEPLRLWTPVTCSADGLYTLVGPYLFLGADGTQHVEIGGTYWWTADYVAPVVLTGFAADAFIDITIECDYETDTLTYVVTDGVKTETGTYAYTGIATGNGNGWTFVGNAGSVGEVDLIYRKIHGSNAHSPYDINQDRVVDQKDLDILEAEMAQ